MGKLDKIKGEFNPPKQVDPESGDDGFEEVYSDQGGDEWVEVEWL